MELVGGYERAPVSADGRSAGQGQTRMYILVLLVLYG